MVLSPLVLVLRGLGIGIGIEGQNFDSIGIGIGIEGPSIDFWYWYWYWYCNPWKNHLLIDKLLIKKVEEVFKKLNVNCPIIGTNRRGKFLEDRQRKLIATFSSPWDARLVISSAIQKKLFETDIILITTDLSKSDIAIERKLISKR